VPFLADAYRAWGHDECMFLRWCVYFELLLLGKVERSSSISYPWMLFKPDSV
jgi:hypothetical protein